MGNGESKLNNSRKGTDTESEQDGGYATADSVLSAGERKVVTVVSRDVSRKYHPTVEKVLSLPVWPPLTDGPLLEENAPTLDRTSIRNIAVGIRDKLTADAKNAQRRQGEVNCRIQLVQEIYGKQRSEYKRRAENAAELKKSVPGLLEDYTDQVRTLEGRFEDIKGKLAALERSLDLPRSQVLSFRKTAIAEDDYS